MRTRETIFLAITLFLAVSLTTQASKAQCVYPITSTFGVADNFSLSTPDPIPYNPALPQFVAFLNGAGLPTSKMKTFDNQAVDHHMVATLRHGLRHCFSGATSLKLCFRARAGSGSKNDAVYVYNTNFTNNTFPVIFSSAITPALISSWNPGTTAMLCINLTQQMTNNQIGDMLQFRVEDDTAVDFIRMTLQ
jgi:hypothetical protein